MSDDLVTRLRESDGMTVYRSDDGFMSIHPGTDLMGQAADEIERLRAEVVKWKKVAKERNPKSWANLVRKKYGIEDMYE